MNGRNRGQRSQGRRSREPQSLEPTEVVAERMEAAPIDAGPAPEAPSHAAVVDAPSPANSGEPSAGAGATGGAGDGQRPPRDPREFRERRNHSNDRGGYAGDRGPNDRGSFQNNQNQGQGDRGYSNERQNGGDRQGGGGGGGGGGNDRFRGRRRRNGRGRNRNQNQGQNQNYQQQNYPQQQGNPGEAPAAGGAPVMMQTPPRPVEVKEGLLEIMNEGYGFLRFSSNNYLPHEDDVYVGANIVRRFAIRPGSMIEGEVLPPNKRGQKASLMRVLRINKKDPELHAGETSFKNLLPIDPNQRYRLETDIAPDTSMRIIDMLTPIGRGQRALIVAPPRSGKTVIMQKMANAIHDNYPDVQVIILLIDERPEEVTDFKRSTKAEVIASCLDETTANHVKITEVVLEKMKRQVEAGHHVVCLLDSITRLGRAYNNETKHSGRIMSGGVDAKTLAKPKAFFGTARACENGGSVTIIATALIDTGSRMDQVIFEEFKGTGNMELVLSRQLANNRIYPAIDIPLSGTRKEEKLFAPDEHQKLNVLRRVLNQLNPNEAMRLLIDRVEKTKSNGEFLAKFDVSGG